MKNKKVIIFGVSDFAKLIKHYFDIDTNYQIEAFCIDDDYKKEDTFCGLPVIKYSEIGKYPPNEYCFLLPWVTVNWDKKVCMILAIDYGIHWGKKRHG